MASVKVSEEDFETLTSAALAAICGDYMMHCHPGVKSVSSYRASIEYRFRSQAPSKDMDFFVCRPGYWPVPLREMVASYGATFSQLSYHNSQRSWRIDRGLS